MLVPTTSRWNAVDLVGHASSDGSVAPTEGDSSPPPFAPGALVSLLRASVDEESRAACGGSIELVEGVLRVRLDPDSIDRIGRVLRDLRERLRSSAGDRGASLESVPR